MNGVLNLNKSSGMTSHDCVNRIRRIYGTKKVGHTGTLDPMATGVLPILVGNAVKASEYIMSEKKTYIAGIRFGYSTDTEDITGSRTASGGRIPSEKEVKEAIFSFVGEYMQIPPLYSAIKQNGRKLYELAREGKTVERAARKVEIFAADYRGVSREGDFVFEVTCSKGTYIRTLITDIASRLGTLATMASLERSFTCGFSVSEGVTLEALDKISGDEAALEAFLCPVEKVFSGLPVVRLDSFFSRLAGNGLEIYVKKAAIEGNFTPGDMVRFHDDKDIFFALAKAGIFDDKLALKPCKFFI